MLTNWSFRVIGCSVLFAPTNVQVSEGIFNQPATVSVRFKK